MSNYIKLLENLDTLKLYKIREYLPNYLNTITDNNVAFIDALHHLTDKEIKFQDERASQANVKVANFPFIKTLDDFDFDFQPSINKSKILDLSTLRFIDGAENILFLGPSGVGKTHLATSIGIEASKNRYSCYFISCHDLITHLNKAQFENKLETKLRHFLKYKVLIIDEIGYLPVDKQGANLFFQLIAKRYEKKPTIITTNQPFSKWGEVFSDNIIANAILDRLLHHSHIIKIKGQSYRIKDKINQSNSDKSEY